MSKNPGIKFGDFVSVRKAGQDGYIWLSGRVFWLGHASFKVEMPGSITKQLLYEERLETWKET